MGHQSTHCLQQATALPRLCNQLSFAGGLRQLVLELGGRAAWAVPAKLAALSSLTQLDTLQLDGLMVHGDSEHYTAALSPLTCLTRLELRMVPERDDPEEEFSDEDETPWQHLEFMLAFPWRSAVCGLTRLEELHVGFDSEAMCRGALPAALSQLAALRRLSVLGMKLGDAEQDGDQLLMAALPALETVALRLHTFRNHYPGLCHQQRAVFSRLVSLRLALRYEFSNPDSDMHLPTIVAPALTELTLDNMVLAADSEQLSWLPALPVLRRLVLIEVKTASIELPHGIAGCSGLTELVLERLVVSYKFDSDYPWKSSGSYLRSLPADQPFVSHLERLSLNGSAVSRLPPVLGGATALEHLDLRFQLLTVEHANRYAPGLQDLHVLDGLTRLTSVDFGGSRVSEERARCFQAAHPNVRVHNLERWAE